MCTILCSWMRKAEQCGGLAEAQQGRAEAWWSRAAWQGGAEAWWSSRGSGALWSSRAFGCSPYSVGWNLHNIELHGDLTDEDGKPLTKELELWWWDPVECICELIANLVFKEIMCYAPEHHYQDKEGKI